MSEGTDHVGPTGGGPAHNGPTGGPTSPTLPTADRPDGWAAAARAEAIDRWPR